MSRLSKFYFISLFTLIPLLSANIANAEDLKNMIKEDLENKCHFSKSTNDIAACAIAMHRYELVFPGDYIKTPFIIGNQTYSCSTIIENLDFNSGMPERYKNYYSNLSKTMTCNQIGDVLEAIYNFPTPDRDCPAGESYNFDQLVKCVSGIYNVKRIADGQKALTAKIITIGGEDFSAITRSPERFKQEYLGDKLSKDYSKDLYWSSRKFAERCSSYGYGDQKLDHDISFIRRQRVSGLDSVPGESGKYKFLKFDCDEFVKALVAAQVIAESDVKEFMASPTCDAGRSKKLPFTREIAAAVKPITIREFCSSKHYQFITKIGKLSSFDYDEKNGCSRSLAGLPIVLTWYAFQNNSCEMRTMGGVRCTGTVLHYCSAADKKRQKLDCIGQTFTIPAEVILKYDIAACEWKTENMSMNFNEMKSFQLQ